MAYTITISNQKGGVGKTQSAANIAYAIAARQQRVLAIDADPQSSLTLYMGCDPVELDLEHGCLHHALLDSRPVKDIILRLDDFDLIPSSIRMARRMRELLLANEGTGRLRRVLQPLHDHYDFIVIDTPPSFSQLFLNTLTASDGVIIPIKTDRMSAYGFTDLLETIAEVREEANPNLEVIGVIPTMYQKNYTVDEDVLVELQDLSVGRFQLFPPVRRSTNFDKAFDQAAPALKLYPDTPGIDTYERIAEQLVTSVSHAS